MQGNPLPLQVPARQDRWLRYALSMRLLALTMNLALLSGLAACGGRLSTATQAKSASQAAPWVPAAIAHAGVMTPPSRTDGCRRAVDVALAALAEGAEPVDAAVAGVAVLEDDPRFNAGTGSHVRLDGKTVQMDAAVTDSTGRWGSVALLEEVRNPAAVARAVMDSPHRMLAGEGATQFARAMGHPVHDPRTTHRLEEAREVRARLVAQDPSLPKGWQSFDWRKAWNFKQSIEEAGLTPEELGSDTVGILVRSADGRFAGALSTGGWIITLRGRVGDVALRGAGLYATPEGAAAATGTGERIIDELATVNVVNALAGGASPKQAATRVVDRIRGTGSIGLIVMTPTAMTAVADRDMAWAARSADSQSWLGTDITVE